MPTKPQRQNYSSNQQYQDISELSLQIDLLKRQVRDLESRLGLASATPITPGGISHGLYIPAAADPNATAQVSGQGIIPSVPSLSSISITSSIGAGFGSSPSFVMTITSASGFRAAIGTDAPTSITAHTIPIAKITGGGTDGSITVNANGRVSAYVDPT